MAERQEANEFADTLHRHGDPDTSKWDEQPAVTDRPNDTPLRGADGFAVENSTLASRAQARGAKRIGDAENKAVSPDSTTTKRRARKPTS